MPPSEFRGNDLDAWIAHFGLSEKLGNVLKNELEVKSVDDLRYVFEDQEMLDTVRSQVTRIELKKFLEAKIYTNPHLLPPTPPPSAVVASAVLSASCDLPLALVVPSRVPSAIARPPAPPSKPISYPFHSSEAELEALKAENRRLREAEHLRAVAEKQADINKLLIKIKHSASLDIAFMIDCTGSMRKYLKAVQDDISKLVVDIHRLHPQITLRIAFVGYRDHSDNDLRLVLQPFTEDINIFTQVVAAQEPTGGGDTPEDVFGGLQLVRKLDWISKTRMLFHIGDAPCHGTAYHESSMDDDYPSGDPNGLTALELLTDINEKQIEYTFGKITKHTDIMIAKFNEVIKKDPCFVKTIPVTNLNLIALVTKTTTSSLLVSVSTSGYTDEGKVAQKSVELDPRIPQWQDISIEGAMKYVFIMPTSIDALCAEIDDHCVSDFPELSSTVQLKIGAGPFAKGTMKAAYHGQYFADVAGSRRSTSVGVVIKESLAAHAKFRTKADYEKFLVCHRAAKFLATGFNKIKPHGCPSVEYVDAHMLQLMARRPEQPFVICEGQVPGRFEKFNNNTGCCCPCPTLETGINHEAVQAFSHWTYHATKARLMVVDCQGGFDKTSNRFMLTDPAVHAANPLLFGSTNMSSSGFELFLASHVCNVHCAALGLPVCPSVRK